MKKHVFSLGLMLVSALAFTNCAKQEVINDTPEQQPAVSAGVPFELSAGMDTKTEATDAGVITWAEGDKLSVFHAEAETTNYSKNDAFTFEEGSSFKGTLQDGELTADAYDWYALYPYYSTIPSPANTTTGYTAFKANQTQTGNSSKAHLCGSNVPMYGKATGVSKNVKPVITMNQAASVIKVHVTNALEDDLTVTSVAFTAPVNIVGNYFINFAGEQPSFTETGTPKKTATLTVKEGDTIAKNGTADFYIVVKPFEAAANDEITVSVNGYKRTIELASAVTFAPGKIKTVNFSYDKVENYLADGDYVIMAKDADKYYAVSVDPNGTTNRRDYVEVAYAGESKFNTPNSKIIWNFARTGSTYKISNGSDYMTVGNNTIPLDDEGADLTVSENEGIYTITSGDRYLAKNGTYGFGFYASGTGIHNLYIVPASLVVVPIINVTSEKTMEVPNGNGLYAIEYNISNPIAGKSISAVADVTWIKDFDYSTPGEVSFAVEAQAAAALARSGKITLSYEDADDVVVTVNQAAGAGGAADFAYIFTSKSWAATRGGVAANWTSGKAGAGFSNNGIQVTTSSTGANGTSVDSFTSVSKVVVTYNTNKSAGDGTLSLEIGDNTAHSADWAYSGSGDGRKANYTCTFNIDTPESGKVKLTVNTKTNSIYVVSVTVTAAGIE